MLLSKLKEVLNKEISLALFREHASKEIQEYKISLNKKGSSTPIFLNEDLETIFISESNIKFLCQAFLQSELDQWELNYVAEALLLSEKTHFENNTVEEALLSLSDVEYFDLISKEFVEEILKNINIK